MMNLALSLPEKTDVDFKTEAPPPETQSGPVYKVVGSTFEKVVLDPTKDVLLEMYRPRSPPLPTRESVVEHAKQRAINLACRCR